MSTKGNITIEIEHEGKVYTLEYTRRTAAIIEGQGFDIGEIGNKPNIMIPLLVYGAFIKNHKNVNKQQAFAIFEDLADKEGAEDGEGFLAVLIEMYSDTVTSMTTDKDDEDGKNRATWKVNRA